MTKDLHYIAPEQMALYQAAPELLEACKVALEAMREVRDDEGEQYNPTLLWMGAWDGLKQAILKAEGRE